jgi:hypothetical protein
MDLRGRVFGRVLALVSDAALVPAATPARANVDLSGVDPVSRWAHSLPATCSRRAASEGVAIVTDLAPLTFGGNVHLGDTQARVASEVGLGSTLRPSSAAPSCPGYTAVGFCSWKRTACACPEGNYVPDKLFGVVVFNRGRAVAFAWDYGECGFG